MEATIESVFQQEGALCQPVASNHVMVTKLPRACCLVPKLHIREGAQGLVTSEQTHRLFSLQPVLLCPYLSGSLPFCSPCGQSGKWTISTGHSHRAHSPVGLSSQNTCGVCCAGVYFQIPLSAPSMGASCLRLSNMVTGSLISSGFAPNPAAEILWPSGLNSLPAIMTVLSFQIMLLASSRFLN